MAGRIQTQGEFMRVRNALAQGQQATLRGATRDPEVTALRGYDDRLFLVENGRPEEVNYYNLPESPRPQPPPSQRNNTPPQHPRSPAAPDEAPQSEAAQRNVRERSMLPAAAAQVRWRTAQSGSNLVEALGEHLIETYRSVAFAAKDIGISLRALERALSGGAVSEETSIAIGNMTGYHLPITEKKKRR